jgi:hypothetical protein
MALKLIEDLVQSDIFNIFYNNKFGELSSGVSKRLSAEEKELFDLVSSIKSIKEGKYVNGVPLSSIKNYKEKMEGWIYDNLTYPITNEQIYKTMLKTLNSGDKEMINLLALSYPDRMEKVLIYNAGKDETITPYTVIYHFLQELNLNGKYKYQSASKHYTQKEEVEEKKPTLKTFQIKEEQEQKKEKIVKEISKEIVKHHLAQENREDYQSQQKYENIKDEVKRFLDKVISTKKQTFKNIQDFSDLQAQNQLQLKEAFSTTMKNITRRLIIKEFNVAEIYRNILFPVFSEMSKENKKDIQFLWKLQDHDKEVITEDIINNGFFWKIFNTDKDFFQNIIHNTMKFDPYSDANNYQLMFNIVSLCSVNEQTFRERLSFFEDMGLNLNGKILSYSYFDENNKPKIRTIDLKDLNDRTANKENYKENSFADLILSFNNEMWNRVMRDKIREKTLSNNKIPKKVF